MGGLPKSAPTGVPCRQHAAGAPVHSCRGGQFKHPSHTPACPAQYWDDPSDAVRPDEGTLLPLWEFANPRAKRRAVTALAWSPRYFDLFAVGYGSFDFLHPAAGLVSIYSLKSPGHPEASFATGAGVMSLDFHPDHPNLLAVGCYDGHICIFDVRAGAMWPRGVVGGSAAPALGHLPPAAAAPALAGACMSPLGPRRCPAAHTRPPSTPPPPLTPAGCNEPLYRSDTVSGKHTDPVWQVCWQRTDGHELKLCSISTDGRVTAWSVSKNELSHTDVLELRSLRGKGEAAAEADVGGDPEAGIAGAAGRGTDCSCCS